MLFVVEFMLTYSMYVYDKCQIDISRAFFVGLCCFVCLFRFVLFCFYGILTLFYCKQAIPQYHVPVLYKSSQQIPELLDRFANVPPSGGLVLVRHLLYVFHCPCGIWWLVLAGYRAVLNCKKGRRERREREIKIQFIVWAFWKHWNQKIQQ